MHPVPFGSGGRYSGERHLRPQLANPPGKQHRPRGHVTDPEQERLVDENVAKGIAGAKSALEYERLGQVLRDALGARFDVLLKHEATFTTNC